MSTKYQKQFEINRVELEIIEKALRDQAKQLGNELLDQRLSEKPSDENDAGQITHRMEAIQSLLGSLHNQKIWYRPEDHVPLG